MPHSWIFTLGLALFASHHATVLGAQAPSSEKDYITVIVLDHTTKGVVPLADVYFLDFDQEQGAEFGEFILANKGICKPVTRKFGQHFQADEFGQVKIPRAIHTAFILAEWQDTSAILQLDRPMEDRVSIFLAPKQRLQILVTDSSGAPVANVPVAIQVGRHFSYLSGNHGTTDHRGSLTLPDIDTGQYDLHSEEALFAAIDIPLKSKADGDRVEITEAVLKNGVVHLTLPPTGNLRITVRDAQGNISLEPGTVKLSESDYDLFDSDIDPFSFKKVETVDGVAIFNFVGLGMPLEVSFRKDGSNDDDSIALPGLNEPGKWVEATIVRSEKSILTGSVLDPDGNLLVDQNVSLQVKGYDRNRTLGSMTGLIKLDHAGRFHHEIQERIAWFIPTRRKLTFETTLDNFGLSLLTIEIDEPASTGAFDLGEITLKRASTLLTGRVLDEKGEPISAASVLVAEPTSSPNSESFNDAFRATTQADGSFYLKGNLPTPGKAKLKIWANDFETLVQDIELDSKPKDFSLARSAFLHGSLRLDPRIDSFDIEVIVSMGTDSQKLHYSSRRGSDLDGFSYAGPTGTDYSLEVRTKTGETLLKLEGLALTADHPLRPAELQPLDLRGKLKTVKIQAHNAQGDPLKFQVFCNTGESWVRHGSERGSVTLITLNSLKKLRIEAEGYVDQYLENIAEDQVVILKAKK
jgi:carboxypeptidase family protein